MPPISDRQRDRKRAASKQRKRETRIDSALSKPDFGIVEAEGYLAAPNNPRDFIAAIDGVTASLTSRLDLQSRKKKYEQLTVAYIALRRFRTFDKAGQREIVNGMEAQLRHLDQSLPLDTRPGTTKGADPIRLILKLMLGYGVQSANHRSTLSRDGLALRRANKMGLSPEEFRERVSTLRTSQAAVPSNERQTAASTASARPLANSPSPDPAGDSERSSSPEHPAKIRGLAKLKRPSVSVAIIETDAEGNVQVRAAEVAFRSLADYRRWSKTEIKTALRASVETFRSARSPKGL